MAKRSTLCTCGHAITAHQHYRRGSDCGICGSAVCRAFRPSVATPSEPPPRVEPTPKAPTVP